MIQESIQYPFEGDNTFERLVIGGGLSLVSFFIYGAISILGVLTLGLGLVLLPLSGLPLLGVAGYCVRVLRSTVEGDAEPPAFDDVGRAFRDGLFASILGLIYYFVPIVLFVAFVLLGGSIGNDAGAIVSTVGTLVAGVLGIGASYVYPIGLTRYAMADDLTAAFAFGELTSTMGSVEYLTAWLFGFLTFTVGCIAGAVVVWIPFLGWVAGPLIVFIVTLMSCRAFGLAYTRGESRKQSQANSVVA